MSIHTSAFFAMRRSLGSDMTHPLLRVAQNSGGAEFQPAVTAFDSHKEVLAHRATRVDFGRKITSSDDPNIQDEAVPAKKVLSADDPWMDLLNGATRAPSFHAIGTLLNPNQSLGDSVLDASLTKAARQLTAQTGLVAADSRRICARRLQDDLGASASGREAVGLLAQAHAGWAHDCPWCGESQESADWSACNTCQRDRETGALPDCLGCGAERDEPDEPLCDWCRHAVRLRKARAAETRIAQREANAHRHARRWAFRSPVRKPGGR